LEQGHGEGLILVDEIAHGTGPAEGAAIAQAIAEELNRQSSITVITTHYPSLACMEGVVHLRVRGLGSDPLQQGDLHTLQRRMDYRLEETGPQGAIWSSAALVAEAMGLDRKVIARARELQEKRDTT
jgi:DNA mismatch repair protein MutS2